MKIAAFITVHVGFNFGSKLQTIATSEVLKKLNYTPICVNYIPPRVTHCRYWQDALISPRKFLRRFFFFPVQLITEHNFDGYLRKYCNLSRKIYNLDSFKEKCPEADVYVSGSDQLWNYKHNEGNDRCYFFEGIKGKKIAFASSIGMKELPIEYAKYMKDRLSKYAAVSVREQSAVALLNNLGINATHVLDPTLLLDRIEWEPFASRRLIKENYLFVYLPYNIKDKDLVYRTIRRISSIKGLTVVSYSDTVIKDNYADKTVYFVNPGDILSLIMYADFVVTNSFHGTAFSINMNKQFWTYMPSEFSTRITSILHLCGLCGRLLEDEITEEQINEVVSFDFTNNVLHNERQKTFEFLNIALQ